MKITARGWSRNMGDNTIANCELSELTSSRDHTRNIHFGRDPVLFKGSSEVSIDWGMRLNYSGKYRMEVHISRDDVMQLFKTMYGSQLDVDLLEHHGFTVADDLKKKVLGEIKLADLTIGDLAGIVAKPEPQEAPAPPTFRRRL
jgi:hypothetical protein